MATLTTLASLTTASGKSPFGGVIEDSQGNLFGTTIAGVSANGGTIFEIVTTGSTYPGQPSVLVNFNLPGPVVSLAGLTIDGNGNLFGTTIGGGSSSDGA